MAKVILEFEGAIESLQIGINSLARLDGWVTGDTGDPLPYAKRALAKFIRDTVLLFQTKDVEQVFAVKSNELAQKKTETVILVENSIRQALDGAVLTATLNTDDT